MCLDIQYYWNWTQELRNDFTIFWIYQAAKNRPWRCIRSLVFWQCPRVLNFVQEKYQVDLNSDWSWISSKSSICFFFFFTEQTFIEIWRSHSIFTFSPHAEYVKRGSIVIAWLKKKSSFDECLGFLRLRTQNEQKNSICWSVCLYVRPCVPSGCAITVKGVNVSN